MGEESTRPPYLLPQPDVPVRDVSVVDVPIAEAVAVEVAKALAVETAGFAAAVAGAVAEVEERLGARITELEQRPSAQAALDKALDVERQLSNVLNQVNRATGAQIG